MKDGEPVPVSGRAKEILALVAMHRGREISNHEIYSTIWEKEPTSQNEMTAYFHGVFLSEYSWGESTLAEMYYS